VLLSQGMMTVLDNIRTVTLLMLLLRGVLELYHGLIRRAGDALETLHSNRTIEPIAVAIC
jgi:hypothetical protein